MTCDMPLLLCRCCSSSSLNFYPTMFPEDVFGDGVTDWKEEYAPFAKYGWGPSVQAEKWNGRHAMFGWVFMCACAYAKGHGLIPDAESALNLKEWGTLATISNKDTITNERAIILIANVHFFFISLCATLCPLPFSDSLLLEPGQEDEEPYGFIPNYKDTGVTKTAEIINGRLAMLGIIALMGNSAVTGRSMIDIINEWIGGAYF